jgi:hypothetical protein
MLLDLEPTTWEVYDLHQNVCHDRYSFVSLFLICAEPSYSHVCAELHVKCLWENTCLLISCLTVFIQQKGDAATCAEDSFTWTFTPFSSVLQIHSPSPFPRKHAFPCPNPKFAPEKDSNIPGHRPSCMPFSRWKKEGSIQWE